MSTNKTKREELVELGQKLQNFYDSGYVSKKQALWFSFLKGLASGLGAFLGGTIVIGLLLWLLSYFNHVPFLDHITRTIQHSLNSH